MIRFIILYIHRLVRFFKPGQIDVTNERIAVISFHKIGDSIFSIPALKYLVKNYRAEIMIFCYPESKVVYELIFPELKYSVISQKEIYYRRIFKLNVRKKIDYFDPGYIFDLTGTILSASLILGARGRIYGISELPYNVIYTQWSPKRKEPHLMDLYFDALSTGMSVKTIDQEKEFGIIKSESKLILIHPFAGWEAKEWGLENFKALYNKLEILGYSCKFIMGKDRADELKKIPSIITKNLHELLNEIKNCAVFIGNDSGPVYIASLLGKPTFTIYGPTNPCYSLPKGESHFYIQKIVPCSPGKNQQYCFTDAGRKGCPSYECMKQLSLDKVINGIVEFLKMNGILPDMRKL